MKAIVCDKYGPAENLQIQEISKPVPTEKQVLLRIKSTAINDYDWSYVRGEPGIYRLLFGLSKPKNPIPGMELSGVVEEVGSEVLDFKVGDEVYGDTSEFGFGTFAEYIAIDCSALFKKPDSMSFEEATSISHASMLAWQSLHDIAFLKQKQKILINGGGGGVGTFALQMAKLYNAEVTGVDTGDKLRMMKEIGFDRVIDYKKEDFAKQGLKYDIILDCKTTRSASAHVACLNERGVYVTVGGSLWKLLQNLIVGSLIGFATGKRIKILALKPNKDLDKVNQLYIDGKLKAIVDGPYKFEEIPKLIDYFGEGKHIGKVVVNID